jgi:cell division protein FtsA
VVDEQDGIGAPVGMMGARLEVNVHIVTGAASSTQNIVSCVNRAGVTVVDTVIEQLAAAERCSRRTRRSSGVAASSTSAAALPTSRSSSAAALWHTGGRCRGRATIFTSDIASGCARRSRRGKGEAQERCALSSMVGLRRRRSK